MAVLIIFQNISNSNFICTLIFVDVKEFQLKTWVTIKKFKHSKGTYWLVFLFTIHSCWEDMHNWFNFIKFCNNNNYCTTQPDKFFFSSAFLRNWFLCWDHVSGDIFHTWCNLCNSRVDSWFRIYVQMCWGALCKLV